MFAPFGKDIIQESELKGSENVNSARQAGGIIASILWLIFGIQLMFMHIFAAIALFFGVITIPFGLVHLKLARMAIWPIGAEVVAKKLVAAVKSKRAEEAFEEIRS